MIATSCASGYSAHNSSGVGRVGVGVDVTVTEGDSTLELQANYYIEMELIKITPSESVLQQLKGQGQSVGDP